MNVRLAYILSCLLALASAKMAWDWIRQREPVAIDFDAAQPANQIPEYVTLRGIWLAHSDVAVGTRLGSERTFIAVRGRQAPKEEWTNVVLIVRDPALLDALTALEGNPSAEKPDAAALRALATLAAKDQVTGLINRSAIGTVESVRLKRALPKLRAGYTVLVEGEKPSPMPAVIGFGAAAVLFLMGYLLRSQDSAAAPAPPVIAPPAAGAPPPLPGAPVPAQNRPDPVRKVTATAPGDSTDALAAGLGRIKDGAPDALTAWLRAFARADVFVIGPQAGDLRTAHIVGPGDDCNYLAVFTRLELAMQCLRDTPELKHATKLKGAELLRLAQEGKRGVWVNPGNEANNVKFPAVMIPRFVKESGRS